MIEIKDIGQLDRQVTIKAPTVTVSGNGERVNSWATYATRWAAIEYTGGGEMISDDMAVINNEVKFTIRYDSSVNEKYRVSYRSKEYEIRNIQEVGRMDFLVLTCETVSITGSTSIPFTADMTYLTADTNLYTADQTLYG